MKYDLPKLFLMLSKQLIYATVFLCLGQPLLFAESIFGQNVHNVHVSLELNGASVQEALYQIESKTDFKFAYGNDVKSVKTRLNKRYANATLAEILGDISNSTGVEFHQVNNTISAKFNPKFNKEKSRVEAPQERMKVMGRIIDTFGNTVIGATIVVKNNSRGTISNENGMYALMVEPNDTLVFSSLGYKTTVIPVAGRSVINLTMEDDLKTLMEVTVVSTGYQKIKKENTTGSFTVVPSEKLEKIPVSNVMHSLEGQVPGLQIDIQESDNTFVYGNLFGDGAGETSYNFKIRGQSTYAGEDMPLIVVDGTPVELDIRTLNPNDIKSITFLKDAASASIYGARAANGVIVIDTKRGREGKTRISYSQNHTFSSKPSLSSLPLMNSTQVLDLEQELVDKGIVTDPAYAYSLYDAYPTSDGMDIMFQESRDEITADEKEAMLDVLRGRNNYDQIEKYLLQSSSASNYDLSFSGGKEGYNYFMSGSYSKEKTQTKGNDGERITLLANQEFDLFNLATLSTSLRGSFFNYKTNGIGLSALAGTLTTFLPYNQIVDENGNSVDYYRAFDRNTVQEFEDAGYLPWTYNYIDELNNSNVKYKEQNYSANFSLNIPLYKGLNVNGTYFMEQSVGDNTSIYNEDTYFTRNRINNATYLDPSTNTLSYGIPVGGIFTSKKYTNTSYTARTQLNYNGLINEKHYIDALAGMELRQTINREEGKELFGYNEMTQTSIDIPSTSYTNIYGYTTTMSSANAYSNRRRRFLSYYANASYTYNEKYTISGSARLDDYNNFGVDKKYRRTPLWSTGAKWHLSKEPFMQNAKMVNSLSLRVSYGYNGNISLSTFPFTNISIYGTEYYSQQPYATITAAANPALRWEKTGVFNVGVDFSLFNSRLNGSVEYYIKNSDDLIQNFPVSEFYGLPNNTLTRNTATLKGKGIDLGINGVLVRHGDFSVDLGYVLSYNTNEVTDSRYESYSLYLNGTGSTPPIVGYGLNSLFAFRSAGLDETGSTLIYDKEGNTVDAYGTLSDIKDMKYMGTKTPAYYGSLSASINYKKWSLYVLATYKLDYVMFKPTFGNYVSRYGTFNNYDLNTEVDNRWREEGDEAITNVPGVQGMYGYSYSRYIYSDKQVIPGDHIRLKEISLSYDFSDLVANTFISSASLSFTARNLGLIWRKNDEDLDPDFLPNTYKLLKLPPTAMYTIGLNVNF